MKLAAIFDMEEHDCLYCPCFDGNWYYCELLDRNIQRSGAEKHDDNCPLIAIDRKEGTDNG